MKLLSPLSSAVAIEVVSSPWRLPSCLRSDIPHTVVYKFCVSRHMLYPQCKEIQWFNCRPLPLKPAA